LEDLVVNGGIILDRVLKKSVVLSGWRQGHGGRLL